MKQLDIRISYKCLVAQATCGFSIAKERVVNSKFIWNISFLFIAL